MRYTIYIKLTNDCNLHCRHCYNEMMHNRQYMNRMMLESVVFAIRDFEARHRQDTIDIQLHGGEPLLYPLDGLKRLVGSLECDRIRFGITTNLVKANLGNEYIEFFKKIRPDGITPFVTTSWDKDIRFDGDEEEIWRSNIEKILNANITVQPIVCVTNSLTGTDPKELFDYMRGVGVKNINFERLTRSGRASDGALIPKNRDADNWLFVAYLTNLEYKFAIPLFESVERSTQGFFLGCRARRCMKTVITINPDGSLSACPNTADRTIGRIRNGSMMFDEDSMRCAIASEEHRRNECLTCRFFKNCNGECCQLQFDDSGCPGLTKIYEYLIDQKSS